MIRSQLLAEFLGTFALVFAGCGAMVVNDVYGGVITHAGISLVWGMVVMAMIYALGEVSGAHFNPAVTMAFAVSGSFPLRKVPPYVLTQIAGATGMKEGTVKTHLFRALQSVRAKLEVAK